MTTGCNRLHLSVVGDRVGWIWRDNHRIEPLASLCHSSRYTGSAAFTTFGSFPPSDTRRPSAFPQICDSSLDIEPLKSTMCDPFFEMDSESGADEPPNKRPSQMFFSLDDMLTLDMSVVADYPLTPTTYQQNLCLDATIEDRATLSDDDEEDEAKTANICIHASKAVTISQEAGQRGPKGSEELNFPYNTRPITEDYTVSEEIIGVGESGKVMACYDKNDGTKYALKVLRDGPKARREVHLHYLVCNHKNVVSIMDIYENTFGGVKCLLVVMEFAEGGDLLGRFEQQGSKPYPEEKVSEIMTEIGAAVMYLHDMNIAHRDIKLENILCTSKNDEECVYKLGDFGFAKRPERNHLMESPCCTPFYAPPEVLSRERYDKSCDMWSLGVAIYILLSGYPPFYSYHGKPLSPGMQERIKSGLYAFPNEDWDCIKDTTKDEIRHLLITDPSNRTSIYNFMKSSFITGRPSMCIPSNGSDSGLSEAESPLPPLILDGSDDEQPLSIRMPVSRKTEATMSARTFVKPVTKAPRLHSIQEEVNWALDVMRLGGQDYTETFMDTAGSSLFNRRTAWHQ
uniref:non-specific serine/threonine protein kinase n=1 Tax=Panagrellus redivivus TaxID=6233 RepID=A0A7E4V710_PANRE